MAEYSTKTSELSFSKKFKALREFYNLSYRDMAGLLNYKSSGNIAYFEKVPMTNKPSYQILISLAQIYGISIDWMIGLSDVPYTEATVKAAEIEQASRFVVNPEVINQNAKSLESIISFLKDSLFPNAIITQRLQLADRFILLFLVNYLAGYVERYYVNHEGWKDSKNQQNLKNLIGLDPKMKAKQIKKHPDYLPAFLTLAAAVKPRLGIPYEEYGIIPPEETSGRIDHCILDNRWDLLAYLRANNIDVKDPVNKQ